jgi:hypothetical protein
VIDQKVRTDREDQTEECDGKENIISVFCNQW